MIKIYFDRLKDNQSQKIDKKISPAFLDIHEEDLNVKNAITMKGEAQIVKNHLIIHFQASCIVTMRCRICNEWFEKKIETKKISITESLINMDSKFYDMTPLIREELLLEIPAFAECNGGQCIAKKQIKSYLKKSKDEVYYPFQSQFSKEQMK